MSINIGEHVVLWSPSQKAFQIETVETMLATNRRIYAGKKGGDFIVLGFFETHEDAKDEASKLQKDRDERY